MDPVTLGLCSQIDLDFEVQRAAKGRQPAEAEVGATLLPAEITTARPSEPEPEAEPKKAEEVDLQAVLAKLKQIGGKGQDEEEQE
jgi:hypothetical protein